MNLLLSYTMILFPIVLMMCDVVVMAAKASSPSSSCTMPCVNNGICKQSNDRNRRLFIDAMSSGSGSGSRSRYMDTKNRYYCLCPIGYTGVLCEIKLVLCPNQSNQKNNNNATCSNGNPCQRTIVPREYDNFNDDHVQSNEEEEVDESYYYHCECDRQQSDLSLSYAQQFCDRTSTVFCTNDDDQMNDSKSSTTMTTSSSSSSSSFCMNGGTCPKYTTNQEDDTTVHILQRRSNCHCPKGYSGQHCEIILSSNTTTTSTKKKQPSTISNQQQQQQNMTKSYWNTTLYIITYVTCFIMFMMIILSILIWYGNRHRTPRKKQQHPSNKRKKSSAMEKAKIPKTQQQSSSSTVPYHDDKEDHIDENDEVL